LSAREGLGHYPDGVIDLHTHSNASDGTDSPAALMRAASAAGLTAVALTDHDTSAGWDEAAAAVAETGVALVRGMEISTCWGRATVHLLAYLLDPDDDALLAELARIRESRLTRAQRMTERLSEDFPITWPDVQAQARPGATVGRPHLADALVAVGVVASRAEAFATMLRPSARYYVPHYVPDVREMIAIVLGAGGVPVVAHPGASSRGLTLDDDQIRDLAAAGLAGIEVNHRDHDAAARQRLAALTTELGLLPTGSSDYHGLGKPNRLGENSTIPEALGQIETTGTLPVLRP
jgi:predicted metal-dependent phosphoesterase TrpH